MTRVHESTRTVGAESTPSCPADSVVGVSLPVATTRPSSSLKVVLKVLDLAGLLLGWLCAVSVTSGTQYAGSLGDRALIALGCVGVISALAVMASKRLWLSRVCAVRSAELAGLGSTAATSALTVLVVGDLVASSGPARFAIVGASVSFALVTMLRAGYSTWLRRARRDGRFIRTLVLVGANHHAFELAQLINEQPTSGYRVTGVCAPKARMFTDERDEQLPWLGGYADAADAVARTGANGALVVASALEPRALNRTVRRLVAAGCHVHLSSGMRGIAHERLLPLPMAREPLFYLEQVSLTRSQLAIKRTVDVLLGGLLVIATFPVLLVAAAAVKLGDRGPVLFAQERVGHEGRHFTLYKMRTMVPDAESKLIDLTDNDRDGGPLFKLRHDPRVTRVGRWLRASSIDELPQLLNVIRGDMSLVGPRPALPDEVVHFDDELRERRRMPPGITGLWQVEARDDPSFTSYRRLDLYYIENWSIGLDLAVLATTCGVVLSRGYRMLLERP